MRLLLVDLHSNACMAKLPSRLKSLDVECFAFGENETLLMKSGLIKQKYGAKRTNGKMTERSFMSSLIFAIDHCNPDFMVTNDEFIIHSLMKMSMDYKSSDKVHPDPIKKFIKLIDRSFFEDVKDALRPNSLKKAEAAGFPVPQFETIQSSEALNTSLQTTPRPFFLKESLSIGRQGVLYIEESTKDLWVRSALEAATTPSQFHPYIAQQPADGTEMTISFAAYQGQLLGYTVAKPLKTIFKGGPSSAIEGQYRPQWQKAITNFVKLTGYNGFGGFDVIENGKDLPQIIEANMRLTHTVPCANKLGANLLELFVKAAKGEIPEEGAAVHANREQAFALYPEELMRDIESPLLDELPLDGPWSDPGIIRHMTQYIRNDVSYPSNDLESRFNQKLRK